jgi:hypothetical protein
MLPLNFLLEDFDVILLRPDRALAQVRAAALSLGLFSSLTSSSAVNLTDP